MIMLRLVFFAQLLVMLSGFAILLVTPTDFQTLAVLFYSIIIGFAVLLYALWQFVRHPGRRAWAGACGATPVVCLATPFLIGWLNDGPLPPSALLFVLVAFIISSILWLLVKSEQWRVGGLFSNKRVNTGIAVALGALFALYWLPIVGWLADQDSISLPANIRDRDELVRIAALYFILVAGPALFLSLFTLLYAPVGLVRYRSGSALYIGQLTLALLSLASLAAGGFAVSIAVINPG